MNPFYYVILGLSITLAMSLGACIVPSDQYLATPQAVTTEPVDAVNENTEESLHTGDAIQITATSPLSTTNDNQLPAFPGAEGFGAFTPGGRGGRVIEVTNLNDSGPGSFRAAIEANGPRIVVFRIGGTIELLDRLVIENPFITIAGQTAPGGGVTIKTSPDNTRAAMVIETHDVVMRYLRLRPGPSTEASHSVDALTINAGYNIIIDHCSLSWATDEVVSTWYESRNISLQWNIISEGLYDSTHDEERPHSMGMLLGSVGAGNITVHHNLFAHNRSRTPRVAVANGIVEVANNVIYNSKFGEPGWGPSHVSDQRGYQRVNYVANFVKIGPNGTTPGHYISVSAPNYGAELYIEGTAIVSADNEDLIASGEAMVTRDPDFNVSTKYKTPEVSTTDAFQAYKDVLAQAGTILPERDEVDTRIITDVINGTGHWIDDPAEVGGWPELNTGTPPEDSDHDGMPDTWENSHGFIPTDPTDASNDRDSDGYTNIEEYLNQTDP